jgi:hypothetical protein
MAFAVSCGPARAASPQNCGDWARGQILNVQTWNLPLDPDPRGCEYGDYVALQETRAILHGSTSRFRTLLSLTGPDAFKVKNRTWRWLFSWRRHGNLIYAAGLHDRIYLVTWQFSASL